MSDPLLKPEEVDRINRKIAKTTSTLLAKLTPHELQTLGHEDLAELKDLQQGLGLRLKNLLADNGADKLDDEVPF